MDAELISGILKLLFYLIATLGVFCLTVKLSNKHIIKAKKPSYIKILEKVYLGKDSYIATIEVDNSIKSFIITPSSVQEIHTTIKKNEK